MKTDLQALLDTIADLRDRATVSAVFSTPVTVEGRTIIPVARVGYAFRLAGKQIGPLEEEDTDTPTGEAAGEAEDEGKRDAKSSTGFGGVRAHPMAVIEVTPEGIQVKPIVDEQKLSLAGAMLVGWSIFCLARTLVKIFGQQD